MIIERTSEYIVTMDKDGVTKKVRLATEAQITLINRMRRELDKEPVNPFLPIYVASKMITELKHQTGKEVKFNAHTLKD